MLSTLLHPFSVFCVYKWIRSQFRNEIDATTIQTCRPGKIQQLFRFFFMDELKVFTLYSTTLLTFQVVWDRPQPSIIYNWTWHEWKFNAFMLSRQQASKRNKETGKKTRKRVDELLNRKRASFNLFVLVLTHFK